MIRCSSRKVPAWLACNPLLIGIGPAIGAGASAAAAGGADAGSGASAASAATKIRVKIGFHPAHHTSDVVGRQPHIQITVWL